MRLQRGIIVLMLLGTVSAGCSEESTRYDDAQEMAATIEAEGLGCGDLSQADVEADGEGLPTSSGACSVEGESVQLFVFETDDDADLWFERGRMETEPTARDGNWVAVAESQEVADRVAAALDK